jgi:hypothetical protein
MQRLAGIAGSAFSGLLLLLLTLAVLAAATSLALNATALAGLVCLAGMLGLFGLAGGFALGYAAHHLADARSRDEPPALIHPVQPAQPQVLVYRPVRSLPAPRRRLVGRTRANREVELVDVVRQMFQR